MRLAKSPLRISIGGGGTDLPFYYEKNNADLTFATINKYTYVTAAERVDNKFAISLEQDNEEANKVADISNEYVHNTFKALEISRPALNISSASEAPSGTGLGSSGSFTVSLLKAIETWSPKEFNNKEIAEKAFEIENNMMGNSCGKQDQYAAAFGGIRRLEIDKDGKTEITPLGISDSTMKKLESNLMLFYTNEKRYSEDILKAQKKQIKSYAPKKEKMDKIKNIGNEIRKSLEKGKISDYGKLLDQHWKTKKKFTEKMTNPKIDKMYSIAKENGAQGGKIVGAGGGGFLLVFAEKENHKNIKKNLKLFNARHMAFNFDQRGCRIAYER